MTLDRSRWAAVGAAVAVTLGAGGIGLVRAATPESDPSVFVPITNCRLVDTRAEAEYNVGPFDTPVGADSEITLSGHGETGDCTIPDTATALQLNVTAVRQSENTFLTVWPADAERPDASNLNPIFEPEPAYNPAYNAVTTRLSPTGEFKVYNLNGQVDVVADVTGYFVAADSISGPSAAAAATDGDDVGAIGTTDLAVVDATISVDGAGIVQASAVGTANGDVTADDLWCSLSDTTVFDDGSVQKTQLAGADSPSSISAMRTFEVTEAGDLTVTLVCKVSGDVGAATVENPQLTLTYLPVDAPADDTPAEPVSS